MMMLIDMIKLWKSRFGAFWAFPTERFRHGDFSKFGGPRAKVWNDAIWRPKSQKRPFLGVQKVPPFCFLKNAVLGLKTLFWGHFEPFWAILRKSAKIVFLSVFELYCKVLNTCYSDWMMLISVIEWWKWCKEGQNRAWGALAGQKKFWGLPRVRGAIIRSWPH